MSVMSLCLQDPIMEVRHQFAVKVHQMVQDFQKDPTKGHKAAKWAAVFPLAAMDPTQANCQAAFSFLMEFVAVRRWTSLFASGHSQRSWFTAHSDGLSSSTQYLIIFKRPASVQVASAVMMMVYVCVCVYVGEQYSTGCLLQQPISPLEAPCCMNTRTSSSLSSSSHWLTILTFPPQR